MLQKYITVDGLKDFFCPLKHLWLIDNECTAVFHRDRRTFNCSVISAISGIYLTELELCLAYSESHFCRVNFPWVPTVFLEQRQKGV